MPRFDRPGDSEIPRGRRDAPRERTDFGQADYSSDYGYDPEARAGYRAADRVTQGREDDGQADYSSDWTYDRERGAPHETRTDERYRESRDDRQPSSFMDRAGTFLAGEPRAPRRRGPSDGVLWAVIVERLKDQRGLDLTDVEVFVENAEVTLNGTVRRKEDRRRIEDIADVDGVRHVQNNLRVRDRGHWTFL